MSFIKQFFGKEHSDQETRITAKDITSFIKQKPPLEENSNLDYKSIPPKNINFDELAKDVSAFANSNGGLLVLGVSEKVEKDPKTKKTVRIYPGKITWGNATLQRERIEQHLVGKIHAPITGLKTVPVRKSEKDHRVIFLIDVPKSNNAPHMATPYNKYYERLDFSNIPMSHYKIQNLFRINWTMKEKLIEKIYEPLSKVLRNHIKVLNDYSCPYTNEVEGILSDTYYYTAQMPWELFEQIEIYKDRLKDLDKKEHYVRIVIRKIVVRKVSEFLKKPYDEDIYVDVKFQGNSKNSTWDLYEIEKLLFKNTNILLHFEDAYFRHPLLAITIIYNNDQHKVDLEKFNEYIWKKCLKEINQNTEIKQMKIKVEDLITEAWSIIKVITG